MKPLVVTTPSAHEVLVERSFSAPPHVIWRAHTEPELVKRWMTGPPGHTMPICEMDVRVGGGFRYVWKSPEGEMGVRGEYRTVEPPSRLVHTEVFDDWPDNESLIATTFVKQDGGTLVSVLIAYDSEATRDAVLKTGMDAGMEESYKSLDTFIDELGG